ncbi:MAG TPA: Uma2 family endonuclease [Planctomycetota bacterium]|nr:Uma2 family endonuclease [Planctomycetota bacterium]
MALKTKPRKTVDDYLRLPEGALAELLEGEILTSPSPRFRHQKAVLNLAAILREHSRSRGLGLVLAAPMDVHLPSGDIVQPDVLFLASNNPARREDWIRGVPDLIVEVLSPENPERDRLVKRRLYEQNAVREYWIVDPEERSVEILGLSGSAFSPLGYFQEPDTLTSSVLAGLELPVGEIFA